MSPQRVCPAGQTQSPSSQVSVGRQTTPQPPQLSSSVVASRQPEVHGISGGGHLQRPPSQGAPGSQTVSQSPQ